MKTVTIYTDGACSGNPGPGGWGAILEWNGVEKELSGGAADTTNNRMELTGVIRALSCLKEPCVVELYSDSKYVIDALSKGWVYGWKKKGWIKSDKKPALNVDLWQELLPLVARHEVHYHWVKGHASNEKNNRCDQLAVAESNMLDKDGNVPNMDRAMLADACATCAGAVCGTSTVTTFVESSAGVAEGGRTGLASMATAVMFFIAMFLSPVAQLIPTYACAAALIYVGVLMMSNVRNINWDDPAAAVTGFVTVAFMPLTYNISYGIAFGLISYVFVKIFTGKIKDINVGTWIISILFALMFFLTR